MIPVAARRQEVFMDLVSLYCCQERMGARFMFDKRFESMLTEGERGFKDTMLSLLETDDVLGKAAKETRAYKQLLGFLENLGLTRSNLSDSSLVREDNICMS